MIDVLAIVLIALAGLDVIATVVLVNGARNLHEAALSERAIAAAILTGGAIAAAVLGGSYLLTRDVPADLFVPLLAVGFLALSIPQLIWVVLYLRGGFR